MKNTIRYFGKPRRANENIDRELHFAPKNSPRSLRKNYFRYRDLGFPDFPIFDEFPRIFIKASRIYFFCQNRATGLYFNVLFRFCPGIVYIFIFSLFLSGLPDFVRPLLPINNYPSLLDFLFVVQIN